MKLKIQEKKKNCNILFANDLLEAEGVINRYEIY